METEHWRKHGEPASFFQPDAIVYPENVLMMLLEEQRTFISREGWEAGYAYGEKKGMERAVDAMQSLINEAGGIGGVRHFQDMLEKARTLPVGDVLPTYEQGGSSIEIDGGLGWEELPAEGSNG